MIPFWDGLSIVINQREIKPSSDDDVVRAAVAQKSANKDRIYPFVVNTFSSGFWGSYGGGWFRVHKRKISINIHHIKFISPRVEFIEFIMTPCRRFVILCKSELVWSIAYCCRRQMEFNDFVARLSQRAILALSSYCELSFLGVGWQITAYLLVFGQLLTFHFIERCNYINWLKNAV